MLQESRKNEQTIKGESEQSQIAFTEGKVRLKLLRLHKVLDLGG